MYYNTETHQVVFEGGKVLFILTKYGLNVPQVQVLK